MLRKDRLVGVTANTPTSPVTSAEWATTQPRPRAIEAVVWSASSPVVVLVNLRLVTRDNRRISRANLRLPRPSLQPTLWAGRGQARQSDRPSSGEPPIFRPWPRWSKAKLGSPVIVSMPGEPIFQSLENRRMADAVAPADVCWLRLIYNRANW